MIFKVLLYYALAKGVWKGLHKPRPRTLADWDKLIRELYVMPIREQLNRPIEKEYFSALEAIQVEPGSMR